MSNPVLSDCIRWFTRHPAPPILQVRHGTVWVDVPHFTPPVRRLLPVRITRAANGAKESPNV